MSSNNILPTSLKALKIMKKVDKISGVDKLEKDSGLHMSVYKETTDSKEEGKY